MKKVVLLTVLAMFLLVGHAMALDLIHADDFWGPDFWFDKRVYHESSEGADTQSNLGGWYVGISVHNDDKRNDIDRVELISDVPSKEGLTHTIVLHDPARYPWLQPFPRTNPNPLDLSNGDLITTDDWGMYFGHKMHFGIPMRIRAYDKYGALVNFVYPNPEGGLPFITQELKANPRIDLPVNPVCEIKRMAIRKNGDLMVKLKVPYDTRNSQIRIRIFGKDWGMIYQEKINPPYEIVTKGDDDDDRKVKPDILKIYVPGQYAGHDARIEYRVWNEPNYKQMQRGLTWFVLPSLED